jgi:SRSO17 transposase
VSTTEDQTVVAGHSVELDPARWQELFDQSMGRVAGRFARADLRRRARAFVRGLLADVPRKNCWTIAEHVGDPGATLVIDETGDLKKGTHTVGCSASTARMGGQDVLGVGLTLASTGFVPFL